MKITILQRGGTKRHEEIETAARWALADLGLGTRMRNKLAIRIEMRATKLERNTLGVVYTKALGSRAQRKFTIIIRRDDPWTMQLETLMHELVHVAQFATGRFQHRNWANGVTHYRWEGQAHGCQNTVPYYSRPWEREAFRLQRPMAARFTNDARR